MKILSLMFQWIAVIGLVAYGAWFFMQPQPEVYYHPEEWHSWDGFMAISYESIARKDSFTTISAERFREHLLALKEAGYHPVTPRDVERFLDGVDNLPRKAVLIMIEDGRRQSYLMAEPVLRETGFIATMFVPVGQTSFWDNEYLNKKDIDRMADSTHWSIGNLGAEARRRIDVNGDGEEGPFLTRAMWRSTRPEMEEEFRSRLEGEYKRSTNYLKPFAEDKIDAFIFPFGDYGQFKAAHPQAKDINMELVSEYHRIAFIGSQNAYNSAYSNPYQLTRTVLEGEASGAELIDMLESSYPRTQALAEATRVGDWVIEEEADVVDGRLKLSDNALLWLRGSENWQDVEGQLSFTMAPGEQLVVYVRHQSAESFLRIRMENDRFYVQEQLEDRLLNLATCDMDEREAGRYDLSFRVRGRRLWVRQNNKLVAGPVFIAEGRGKGRIGFSYEGPGLVINSTQFTPLGRRALVRGDGDAPPSEEQLETTTYLMQRTDMSALTDYVEVNRADIIRASRYDVLTIPMLSGGAIPSQMEMTDAVEKLIAEIRRASLQEFMPYLALDSDYAAIGEMLHLEGFDIIWMGDLEYAMDLVDRGVLRSRDMLFITRFSIGAEPDLLDELLKHVNPQRLLFQQGVGAVDRDDLRQAVRYAPAEEYRVGSLD